MAALLGFAVLMDPGHSPVTGSVGDYFWAGAAGTYFWVDPHEKLFAVMMLQMPFVESGRRDAVCGRPCTGRCCTEILDRRTCLVRFS